MKAELKSEPSLLLRYLGSSPALKIVDFFLDNPLFDYSKAEVLEQVPISRNTLFQVWESLEDAKILMRTRKIGKAVLFRLNKESEIVKRLVDLDLALSRFVERAEAKPPTTPGTPVPA